MENHSRRLREPLQWGRRERLVIGGVLAVLVCASIALLAFGLTSGAAARKDCIDITFASTLGAAAEHACGAQARAICASPQPFRSSAQELRAACARADFPYGH